MVVREPKQPSNPDWIAVHSLTYEERYAVVPKEILGLLTEKQLHLLSAVAHASDRYSEYQNKHLEEAEYYNVHSKVIVTVTSYPEPSPGVVWYVGPVETVGGGTVFGVELLVRLSTVGLRIRTNLLYRKLGVSWE